MCRLDGHYIHPLFTTAGHPELRTETDTAGLISELGRPDELTWHVVKYHPVVLACDLVYAVDDMEVINIDQMLAAEREAQALAQLHKSMQRAMNSGPRLNRVRSSRSTAMRRAAAVSRAEDPAGPAEDVLEAGVAKES